MIDEAPKAAARRASPGYLISLGIGVTGFYFLAVAVQAKMLHDAGGQPADAIDHAGVAGLLLAFAMAFVFRLIFWSKVSPSGQALVRSMLQLLMAALVLATIAGAVYINGSSGPGTAALPLIFLGFAGLSQIATLIWLVKFRNE